VLLVENNGDDARLFQRALSGADICHFKVDHLGSLGEALRYLSHGLPDLIAMDLSLPDSVGMETFAAIHERADGVPITGAERAGWQKPGDEGCAGRGARLSHQGLG
jgi:CheY-like chemotaxis protein